MKKVAGALSILLVLISTGAFAEVNVVAVRNPDNTMTYIFYSEEKEVARQVQDSQGKVKELTGKIPDGIVKQYLDTGELVFEWNYKKGKLEGISKEYRISGELLEEMLYKNNERNGLSKKYYQSGKLLAERHFKNGKLEGVTKMFYEGGRLFAELQHKNGQLDGENKMYYEDGQIKLIEIYSNNKKIRVKSFDPQGKVLGDQDFTTEKVTTTPSAQRKEDKTTITTPAK